MSYQVKPADLSGRLGEGLGKGFADQIPKEAERYRLSKGLQDFSQQSKNMNPMQQLAYLSSIPGISPQAIQSFSELAKHQNQGNAYGNNGNGNGSNMPPNPRGNGTPPNQTVNQIFPERPTNLPPEQAIMRGDNTKNPIVNPRQSGQPQIQNEPPLAENTLPRLPWTPEQRNKSISDYISKGFLPNKAEELSKDDEQRYLKEPQVYEERQKALEGKSLKARAELDRQLQLKLQKDEKGLFTDVSGEMKNNLERSMERDLRLNPQASYKDVANEWSNKALDLSKTRNSFLKKAATTGFEAAFKGNKTLNELKQYSKIFKETGNAEEYKNLLKSNFSLSEGAAASIAYEASKDLKKYVDSYHPFKGKGASHDQNARTAATEVGELIKNGDSIQGILWDLSRKNPEFDQAAFLEQLSEDQDQLSLSPLQKREISEGGKNILPKWNDFIIFPFFKR